jgi:hypothetical protein
VDEEHENPGVAWARRQLRQERLFDALHEAAGIDDDAPSSPPRKRP